MKKLKLATVVGTRPEIIRLSEVLKKADLYFDHILIHTGQNYDYELNEVFFSDLGLRKPDHFLGVSGGTLGEMLGNILAKSYDVLVDERPDALLVLGDTNSCLSAVVAKRLKIPIFHMEAGNRCFDPNVPEEINRKIVDVTSDINLAYSENARRNLLQEGMRREHTFVTGSPLAEVLTVNRPQIEASDILERLQLKAGRFLLVSAHREENIDIPANFTALMNMLNAAAEHYNIPVIYAAHPRSRNRIESEGIRFHDQVRMIKPLGFFDYNKLQLTAFCVLSDSGSLAEESNIMGFPAISIRTSTERQEAVDIGSFIVGSIVGQDVIASIEMITAIRTSGATFRRVPDYVDENVALKTVNIIQSYTPIVNQFIWRK